MADLPLDLKSSGPYRFEASRLVKGWAVTARFKDPLGQQAFAVGVGRWLWLAIFRARRKVVEA